MNNILTKDLGYTFTSGTAYIPASAGQPFIPAHWEYATTTEKVWVPPTYKFYPLNTVWSFYSSYSKLPPGTTAVYDYTWVYTGPTNEAISSSNPGGYWAQGALTGYNVPVTKGYWTTKTTVTKTWIAAQAYIAPTAAVAATDSSIAVDYNLGWNAGAVSRNALYGEGRFEFAVNPADTGVTVGIGDEAIVDGFSNFAHAWYFTGGIARVYERGVARFYAGAFTSDDVFAIERSEGEIRYLVNGVSIFSSDTYVYGHLYMLVSMYSGGDKIFNPKLYQYSASVMLGLEGLSSNTDSNESMGVMVALAGASRQASRCENSLSALVGLSSEYPYCESRGELLPLTSYAEGGLPKPTYCKAATGMAVLLGTSYGTGGGVLTSESSMLALDGLSADHPYGQSVSSMLALEGASYTFEGAHEATMVSVAYGYDIWYVPLLSYLSIKSSMTAVSFITVDSIARGELTSTLDASTSMDAAAIYAAVLHSVASAGMFLPAYDGDAETWVVNESKRGSRYEGYGFNSFGMMNGRYVGCRSDGLYYLDGDDDDGTPIDVFINFGKTDFGVSVQKSVPSAYIGVSSTGKLLLKVVAGTQEYIYEARNSSETMQQQRFDIGRGLKATYYEFELRNQNGDDFELASVEFAAIPLSRRI